MSDFKNPIVCTLNIESKYSSKPDKWNHFTYHRLSLVKETSEQIANIFSSASKNYTKEIIDYSPDYHPDLGQVFVIRNFPFPDEMKKMLSNSAVLDIQKYIDDDIKAIIVSNTDCTSVGFQLIDKRHHLEKKFCLFHEGTMFKHNDQPGLIIGESLSCLFEDGNLYFRSYKIASSLFNLNKYLELASDEAVQQFMSCPLVSFEDSEQFKQNLNQTMRRNITLVQKAGILDLTITEIREVIEKNNLPITIEDNAIKIPKDAKSQKNVMNFFTEKMFITLFSKKVCVSNSIRTLGDNE